MDIELVSPAGNLDKLEVAFAYGADAVYVGGKAFNLRARSSNFSIDSLEHAVARTKELGKKIFVTLNILAHDRELRAMVGFIKAMDKLKVDAFIVSDLGVAGLVKENSSVPIHVSTQASVTNWMAAKTWQDFGAKRIVLARELPLTEIKKIKDKLPDLELEVFVHGSMCMTYSGRCQLSTYFSNRDGNRGACNNACRWKYSLVEEKRPGEAFPIYEDETGTYLFNSKDLCTVEFVDKILDAGVSGLKIEGRMKSLFYCATATKVYREAIDSYKSGNFTVDPTWVQQLQAVPNRQFTTGFYFGRESTIDNQNGGRYQDQVFLGHCTKRVKDNLYEVMLKDNLVTGNSVNIIRKSGQNTTGKVLRILEPKNNQELPRAHNSTHVWVELDTPLDAYDVLTYFPENPEQKSPDQPSQLLQ